MNRRDLQQLADIRAREVIVLLTNGLYSGAYCHCGYAVECALKACISSPNDKLIKALKAVFGTRPDVEGKEQSPFYANGAYSGGTYIYRLE